MTPLLWAVSPLLVEASALRIVSHRVVKAHHECVPNHLPVLLSWAARWMQRSPASKYFSPRPYAHIGHRPSRTLAYCKQHFLYFLPLPHGHGSLRPTFFSRLGNPYMSGWIRSTPGDGDQSAGRIA